MEIITRGRGVNTSTAGSTAMGTMGIIAPGSHIRFVTWGTNGDVGLGLGPAMGRYQP